MNALTGILGVIPARGGSKGLVGKNIAPVAGRPLIAWTCEAAKRSRRLTRVIVSTDDDAIAEAARAAGIDEVLQRPAHLATDDALIVDVLVDLVRALEQRESRVPDAVVLLQATSPVREASHIDAAVDLLERTGADTVVSVVAVPHQFNPVSVMRFENGRLHPFADGPVVTRRQEKPEVYARNGPAVLAVRTAILLAGRLYGDDVRPLPMSAEASVDVDDAWDLEIAALALSRRTRQHP